MTISEQLQVAKAFQYQTANLANLLNDRDGFDPVTNEFHADIFSYAFPVAERYNTIMTQYNGKPLGIEHKHKSNDQYTMITPDSAEPGRFRLSFFDKQGFYSHSTHNTLHEAVEEMVRDGYFVESKGILSELQKSPEFEIGNRVSSLIGQFNMGKLTHQEFSDQRQAIHDDVRERMTMQSDNKPVTWTKGTFGTVYGETDDYRISLIRHLKNGHYDNNNRLIKIYKRNHDADNTLSFFKEIPNAGTLANAKKIATSEILRGATMNMIINDKGETVAAVGNEISIARAKVRWPNLIEKIQEEYKNHPRYREQEPINLIAKQNIRNIYEAQAILDAAILPLIENSIIPEKRITIDPEKYSAMFAPTKFNVGDPVTFINDYGVVFENRTITGIDKNYGKENRYFMTPNEAHWFSSKESNFTSLTLDQIILANLDHIFPKDKADQDGKITIDLIPPNGKDFYERMSICPVEADDLFPANSFHIQHYTASPATGITISDIQCIKHEFTFSVADNKINAFWMQDGAIYHDLLPPQKTNSNHLKSADEIKHNLNQFASDMLDKTQTKVNVDSKEYGVFVKSEPDFYGNLAECKEYVEHVTQFYDVSDRLSMKMFDAKTGDFIHNPTELLSQSEHSDNQSPAIETWNTNKPYSDQGQRIAATKLENGLVAFVDIDRCISGVTKDIYPSGDDYTLRQHVMTQYDYGKYSEGIFPNSGKNYADSKTLEETLYVAVTNQQQEQNMTSIYPSLTETEKQELSNFTAVVKHHFSEAPTDSIHKLCTVASDMKKLTIQNTNGILSNETYNSLTDDQEKQIKTITDKDLPGTIASLPYDATAPALKLNIPSSDKGHVMSTYNVPEIPKNKLVIAPVPAKTATEIVSKKR